MSQKTRTCTLCKKRRKIKFFEAREQTGGGVTYRGICRDCHVIDRIDPSVLYVRSNIQLVCQRANIIKHTLTEDMMLWWCENIVRNKKK